MNKQPSSLFLAPDISFRKGKEGTYYLESNTPLPQAPASVLAYLERWAKDTPDSVFLAEKSQQRDQGWETISYAEFRNKALRLAAGLQPLGLSVDKPLMLVSGNSIANALIIFACYYLGVPAVPVSPSYSLLSKRYEKVHYIQELTGSSVVFAQTYQAFAGVLEALASKGVSVITADETPCETGQRTIDQLVTAGVDAAFEPTDPKPDSIAKILFTSGSTGMPKGVINTHQMLTCNQEAMATIWPFLNQQKHVLLDWLPWHHTFGGNHNFNMVLRNGASLYIDDGKPTPEGIVQTLENLKTVSPTISFNVAMGYDLLATALEQDADAARRFFRELRLIFFAAAALPESIWKRLEALIEVYAKEPVPITSSWGQTETAPVCTSVYFGNRVSNNIGLPIPGTSVKLTPVGGLMELRVKGPNIMPGYYNQADKTLDAFDDEGYLRSGDAVELYDVSQPELGLVFKGRVSENFKLLSGTWVNVGDLRVALIARLSPLVSDIVVCGHNEKFIGILMFPNKQACEEFVGEPITGNDAFSHTGLTDKLRQALQAHNLENGASSKRVAKALLLATPPSFEHSEITDKGYLNQRGVISNRKAEVDKLYAGTDMPGVISL
ncbi:feruloyl-CoA synthase [Pseudomaricurvus alkylphenolicus]|uniref:feruloyl-CoA synthase n=1 Tax=Pseudomaricurvus alkylphenolicus TaxID=1306991 RepID=UPI0014225E26|nr:feruloyl-CoA synthase [Pseudomaricurvus alkylphenolicus]NIB43461.1 feruloyl-CoA synthase [Pseudomaricurvus alkylphenolicus]